jgi:type I restriction enzyme S subunit
MQQLLTGKTRLPAFSHHPDGQAKGTKQSDLGEIPGDWDVKPIGNLCDYQNGKAQEHLFNSHDGYKVVSIGNYSEQGLFVETGSYIDWKLKKSIEKFILERGDLAMILNDKTAVGTIIGKVIYIGSNESYVMNQRTMRLTSKNIVHSKYLHFLINSDSVHKRIVAMAKPGTQIYVNTDDILSFDLLYPADQKEQTAITNFFIDMDTEIQTLQQRLSKTQQLKQGMMQELLTGKTRLMQKEGEVQ